MTGRRVDWLIVDDPHSGREEAESPTQRKRVLDWYNADCYTRLSPGAAVFIIATRWHPQDLIGELTKEEHVNEMRMHEQYREVFEVVNLPAICEDPENDPLGRAEGDALFPEVRTKGFLAAAKASLPAYEWDSQYMGDPKSAGGEQADLSRIVWITPSQLPMDIEKVNGWDMALSETQRADYTVGARCSYDPGFDIFYIENIIRSKKMWVKMRERMLHVSKMDKVMHNVQRVGIEAVAGFGAVYQDIKHQLTGELRVEARNPPGGGKLTRALPWLNKIEAGRVYIVRGPWNKDFLEELRMFPDGDHDDQIDAISICWEMLTGRNRNGALLYNPETGRPLTNRPKSGLEQAKERAATNHVSVTTVTNPVRPRTRSIEVSAPPLSNEDLIGMAGRVVSTRIISD